MNIEKFRSNLKVEASTILVDCFDTIIKRNCYHEDIKIKLSKKLEELLSFSISYKKIYELIAFAEKTIIYKSNNEGRYGEYYFNECFELIERFLRVYHLVDNCKIPNDFVSIATTLHKQLELDSIYLDEKMIKFLKKQRNLGKDIVCLSDYFYGKDHFINMFRKLGVLELFSNIFVSCDYNCNKHSGSIYKKLILDGIIDAKSCVMIGDNLNSDYKNGKKYLQSAYWYNAKPYEARFGDKKFQNNIDFKFLTIYKEHLNIFENYSFPLYLFISKLYNQCISEGKKTLFFMSREGQFLKVLFDEYQKDKAKHIDTHYFCMSRNSSLLIMLKDIKEERFETITRQFPDISIYNFLRTLTFDENTISDIGQEISEDTNKQITNFINSQTFQKMINSNKFLAVYNKLREEQKLNFKQYLNSFNVDFEKNGFNLVDVGWKGTMQDNLRKYFDKKVKIYGFYIGLTEFVNITEENLKFGILSSMVPFFDLKSRIFYNEHLNYEQLLRADHNKVVGYSNDKNDMVLYEQTSPDNYFIKVIKPLQKKLLDKFNEIHRVVTKNDLSLIDYEPFIIKYFVKMIKEFSYNDFKLINRGLMTHIDGFGNFDFAEKNFMSKKKFYKDKIVRNIYVSYYYKKYLKLLIAEQISIPFGYRLIKNTKKILRGK